MWDLRPTCSVPRTIPVCARSKGTTSLKTNWRAPALYDYSTREKYESMSFSYKDAPSPVVFWNERLTSLAALRVSLFRHPGNQKGQLTSVKRALSPVQGT
jgi:hypothetical protein